MSKAHRLITRKPKEVAGVDVAAVPVNFLLGASDQTLDDYELTRLAAIADLRKQMQDILDKLNQEMALASLVRWFRGNDRQTLKHAIENEETAEEWAKRMIKERQRSPEELLPLPSLPPGAAHLAAAKRYAERNLAEGKCRVCPKPLAHNSTTHCEEHMAKSRAREQRKKALSVPGSTEYLYAGDVPATHGRQPGTLANLAMHNERRTRALCAETGIPFESAAVSLKAAKEALLRVMPDSRAKAQSAADLFASAGVVTPKTGYKALRGLLEAGKIQRIGKGVAFSPFLYFASGKENAAVGGVLTETRRPKHRSRTKQNSALLKMMRGEETNEE